MEFFLALITPLQHYSVLTSVAGSLFGGEPAVLALGFLSAQNFIHPLTLGVVAFLTALVAESVWFYVGRLTFTRNIAERMTRSPRATAFYAKINRIENGHWLRVLFIAHVFSGTTIVYVLRLGQKITYKRFLVYCALVNSIWTPTVILIGWSAGKGFSLLLTIFESVHLVIGIGLGVALCGYVLYYLFERYASNLFCSK